ncbi:uncharacterized protein LOC141890281 isoform X1 [Acropora palmata]|uniref:uncharacterized protein LOC141890281 isoform X1 n=1 Tax=Acropora palmata TaxID=6131 RepID=UPI003DA0EA71
MFICSSLSSIRLWISGREMSALIAAFRQLTACSTMFRKGLWGGSILSSVFRAGTVGFRWAGAPSYTKITDSSGSRFVLACVRKLSKRAAFSPSTKAEENTSSLIGLSTFTSEDNFPPRFNMTRERLWTLQRMTSYGEIEIEQMYPNEVDFNAMGAHHFGIRPVNPVRPETFRQMLRCLPWLKMH